MQLNAEKYKFLTTGHRLEHLRLNVGKTQVWEKNQPMLLGITIDNELMIDNHIAKICHKVFIQVYKSLNKPSSDNFFDSIFTSKRRQDPLQNDLLLHSV